MSGVRALRASRRSASRFRARTEAVGAAFGALLVVASVTLVAPSLAGAAVPAKRSGTIAGDKAQIAALENQLLAKGTQAQTLVARYDQVAAQLATIDAAMKRNQATLLVEHRDVASATRRLRSWAIDAYVNAASGDGASLSIFSGPADGSALPSLETYLGVASGSLNGAVTTLQNDEHRIAVTELTLEAERSATERTLIQLASAQSAANASVAADDNLLGQAKGNLVQLVTAANARREEAEEAESEETLGAAAQQAVAQPATTPSPPPAQVSPGTYLNPLRGIGGLTSERIDQGVDYSGYGPIFAIGDGVVLSVYCGGWPGGTFISYRLSDGPAQGLVVYAAEDIEPSVAVGQTVSAATVLGRVYEGPDGIETGWADSSGDGTTMAADNGQYYGGNSTAFGANFSGFLQSLGAPGGVLQNAPTGSLPPGWPRW